MNKITFDNDDALSDFADIISLPSGDLEPQPQPSNTDSAETLENSPLNKDRENLSNEHTTIGDDDTELMNAGYVVDRAKKSMEAASASVDNAGNKAKHTGGVKGKKLMKDSKHLKPKRKDPSELNGEQGKNKSGIKHGYDIRTSEMQFVQAFMRGLTYRDAYEETHDTYGMSDANIRQRANKLMETTRVKEYKDKIRKENKPALNIQVQAGARDTSAVLQMQQAFQEMDIDAEEVTVQSELKWLHLARVMSMSNGNYNWAIQASKQIEELMGMLIDRKEVRVGSFAEMSPKELKEARETYSRQLVDMGMDSEELKRMMNAKLVEGSHGS